MSEINNNDQPEKKDDKGSNYEDLLNGFAEGQGDESADGGDKIVLSNLLDGIDSSDDSSEDNGGISVESDGINIDEIPDINFGDISSGEIDLGDFAGGSEAGEESAPETDASKIEIDMDTAEGADSVDYSAVLNEIDNGETPDSPDENAEESASEEEPAASLINEISLDIDEPESSYAGLIDDDSAEESADEPEAAAEPAESIEEPASEEEPAASLIDEISLDIDEPESSYASLIDDDSAEESAGEPEAAAEPDESAEPTESAEEPETSYASLMGDDIETEEPAEQVENAMEPAGEEEPDGSLIGEISLDIDEPESSYAGLIDDDSAEESSDEPEAAAEPAESAEEPETSYAGLVDDESMESSTEELSFDSGDDGTDKEVFEKLTDDEFSLDDMDSDSDIDEEFVLPQESSEEPATSEIPAVENAEADADAKTDAGEAESTFVIGGDDDMDEDSFLDLDDEESPQEDDLLSSVTDAQDTASTEVMLEGIEMDVQKQITAVTSAELLLAQGKEKEAVDIYAGVSDKKGVTPWVSKRLGQFNIGEPAPESAAEALAENEES